MSATVLKGLSIRISRPLYRRVKKASAYEDKSIAAFIRDLLKDRVDETPSREDWSDVHDARRELKSGKSVPWRSVRRG
jgi:predicted DNA-binding protein